MLKRFLLSVLVALCGLPVAAQKLPFGHYSIEDGLVDSVVFTISQDSQGYLWFGTRAGLNRFDGLVFTTFTEADGLTHNVIRSVYEAEDGVLWIATERGLSRLEDGVFLRYTTEDGIPHHSVRCVAEDDDGAIWFGTYGGGACRLKDGEIEVFTVEHGLAHNKVRAMLRTRDGALWIGTSGGGLSRLEDGVFETFAEAEGLGHPEVRTLMEDADGALWVGTRRGLYRQAGEGFAPVFEGDLAKEAFNVVIQDRRERFWIGTREAGAVSLSETGTTRYFTEQGLADNSVVSIFEDSEGNLWFGTYGGGVSRLSTESIRNYEAREGFTYSNVYCLAEGHDGAMWFGTNGGGISRLANGVFTSFTTANGLAHNKVISAMVDREGRPWFGTLEGVSRLVNGHFETISEDDGLAHNIAYDIIETRGGTFWFATFEGLTHLDGNTFTTFTVADGLPDLRVNFILEARDGSLWLGTADGVSHLVDGRFSNLSTGDGLVSEFVNSIFEDEDGSFWVCTNGGLSHLVDGTITNYTTADGLSHDSCAVALRAEDGNLWIGTNRGVNRFDGQTFSVVTSKEGLVGDLVNRGGGIKDRQGNLWFGTTRGVSMIEAGFSVPQLEPPPVHLTGVWLFDERVDMDEELVLHHDENRLRFDFEAISFRRAQDVVYRYSLEGLDRDWQVAKERTVQYTSLPPGAYTFRVSARSIGGWNAMPASFSFEIVPPIWKRPWFVAGLLLVVVGAVAGRVWALKRQTVVLEQRVRERTAEVEEMNEELRWLALNDRLTNLRNRHYVYEIMPEEMSRLERRLDGRAEGDEESAEVSRLGLALIDLDHFKRVNDEYDHAVGDTVLTEVSKVFTEVTRDTDVVARWGGEEFLILFRDVDESRLGEMAGRVLEALRSRPIGIGEGRGITITGSLGYVPFPGHVSPAAYSWEDMVKVADVALREAKRGGRDRPVGLTYDTSVPGDKLMPRIARDVHAALEHGLLIRVPDRAP